MVAHQNDHLLYQISTCKISEGVLRITGWIIDLDQPLDGFSARLNGQPWIANAPLSERPAVRKRFPHIPHASQSGIDIQAPVDTTAIGAGTFSVALTVTYQGQQHGTVSLSLRDLSPARQRVPLPPLELQEHIGQMHPDPEMVLSGGWRLYHDLKQAVEAYRPLRDMRQMLDWGCGCGRVMRFLREEVPATSLSGCDIDAQAIAWISAHMPGPSYTVISGQPPTPYPDNAFDLVFGISIFTHLDEPTQFAWLGELRRITAPGGLVAVSVLGPHATHPTERAAIERAGFFDRRSGQAQVFAPYVGDGYYRLTYHTRAYIEREWSRYFDVLDYRMFGVNSHQDLVILRKQAEDGAQA